MDFFHSIEYVNGRAPYALFNTLYPPLANLLFYIIFYCIPMTISSNWPLDFQQSVLMRRTSNDLRVYQAPMILFLIFVIVCVLMIVFLICHFLEEHEISLRKCVAFCAIFSYGILFSIERGNIIILTLPLTMFFVFYYNSDNRFVRELAYISLAVSAGLKLYPAFFGVLLIRDKQWKATISTVFYLLYYRRFF